MIDQLELHFQKKVDQFRRDRNEANLQACRPTASFSKGLSEGKDLESRKLKMQGVSVWRHFLLERGQAAIVASFEDGRPALANRLYAAAAENDC